MAADAPADGFSDLPAPQGELSPTTAELHRHRDTDADTRMAVLAELPAVIRSSPGEPELAAKVAEVLLRGIGRAAVAAMVRQAPDSNELEIRSINGRGTIGAGFRPSRRLVSAALQRQRGIVHLWHGGSHGHTPAADVHHWALCAPLPATPVPGFALYVAGRLNAADGAAPADILTSDLKFATLVAEICGSLRQLLDLQSRNTRLRHFLPRPVLDAFNGKSAAAIDDLLQPRLVVVTILFCDLRNSSRIDEAGRDDLLGLWSRFQKALAIMSSGILDRGGVIADFQGDAALGFWGWPLDVPDQIDRAAQAALEIANRFEEAARDDSSGLRDFAAGLGLAHGEAVAGRLGTADQVKIDVFGPTVNLASRLETMTRKFSVPILMDEACAARIREVAWARCRRVARVQPHGLSQQLTVSELLPPSGAPGGPEVANLNEYEKALDRFIAGAWSDARAAFDHLPPDGAADFLRRFMDRHPAGPPSGWNGVVVLEAK